jgi:hypothetical protein
MLFVELFLFSCKKENMNDCFTDRGLTAVEKRKLDVFRNIKLGKRIQLVLIEDTVNYAIVEAGSHLLPSIVTSVEGEVLTIQNNNKCNWVRTYKDSILLSSTAPYYRWYFNNSLIQDNVSKIRATKIGTYWVSTSTDKTCWTTSKEFKLSIGSLMPTADSLGVKVYPNPTTGNFNVTVVLPKEQLAKIQITITDASGSIVYRSPAFSLTGREINIPLELLKKGFYNVIVEVNGKFKTQVLLVK